MKPTPATFAKALGAALAVALVGLTVLSTPLP